MHSHKHNVEVKILLEIKRKYFFKENLIIIFLLSFHSTTIFFSNNKPFSTSPLGILQILSLLYLISNFNNLFSII